MTHVCAFTCKLCTFVCRSEDFITVEIKYRKESPNVNKCRRIFGIQ